MNDSITKKKAIKHEVVSREDWLKARKALLEQEKAFTKSRDQLTKSIRDLPWVRVERDYRFQSPGGELSLADLFGDRSQLIIYHFMLGPDWQEGCKSCSFLADHFDGHMITHLNQRDAAFAVVSRAPVNSIESFKQRMGWTFPWVSSLETDFNFDYGVSTKEGRPATYNYKDVPNPKDAEMPGISVFYKDSAGTIFHTYSRYGRGLDIFITCYNYLDMVPKGRDEQELNYGMEWVKLRGNY